MALTENDLPYCAYHSRGKRGVRIAQKSARPSYDFFYYNIMITLATDLVQKFYTYWEILDNQVVLIIYIKNSITL
jgi:hypothetical protein